MIVSWTIEVGGSLELSARNAVQKSFFDPSVQFGLQFEPSETATEMPATNLPAVAAPSGLPVAAPAPENQDEPGKPSEGAEVVRLDRFRKK